MIHFDDSKFKLRLLLKRQHFSGKYNNRRDGIAEIQKIPTEIIHILRNLHTDKAVEKLVAHIRRNNRSILGDIPGYWFLEFIIEEYNFKTNTKYLIFLPLLLNIPPNIDNNIWKQSNIANSICFSARCQS